MAFLGWKPVGNLIEGCVKDAMERTGIEERDLSLYSWPHMWGSTGCGFGGVSGQAMTTAQTVIIEHPEIGVLVYHAGKFAYQVKRMNDKFQEDWSRMRLMGAAEYKEQYERE